jgi:diguanylate cyclase (GGDEF)-like protein
MFERFTERARRVIILAQEEAKRLNDSAVGTEHILLGIIRDGAEGVASKVLESLNISPDRVRAEIESAIGRGERAPYEEVGFTPRAKKVIELALDEARRLDHKYIGTEHLLLGLIREREGVAASVMEAVGADLERVRAQVVLLGEEGTSTSETNQREAARARVLSMLNHARATFRFESGGTKWPTTNAQTDPLTGLLNRRALQEALDTEVDRAAVRGTSCLIVELEIDRFKRINDRFGHQEGDAALSGTAAALRCVCRAGDSLARYGGDEFVIILPQTTMTEGLAILGRLQQAVADDSSLRRFGLTVSIVLAAFPEHGQTSQELLEAADRAMDRV